MNKRIYNILFHTHTVSGIVISVALYIIFFAGSFSFFRDDIVNWERGHLVDDTEKININVDSTLAQLSIDYDIYGRDISLRHVYNERRVNVNMGGSKDSTATEENKKGEFFYLDKKDQQKYTYPESYTLGEFLYRLHFFAQIPYPIGYYLSGFTAFFFLFATLTGLIVHWKKIISNFYVFRPLAKLKTIWTDSHTALGMIGLPFQIVYALTGAFFMLKALAIGPFVVALYGGDQGKMMKELEYEEPTYELAYQPISQEINLSPYLTATQEKWEDFNLTSIKVFNHGDENMHVSLSGHLNYREKFTGIGKVIYKVSDNSIVYEKNPLNKSSYLDGVKNLMFRLHLADYAGYGLRIISFFFGLIMCYVILSGVMIWSVARDKKNNTEKQSKFVRRVTTWYLAICLSMYPMIAIEFLLVKAFTTTGMSFLYYTFFIGWALFILLFAWKDNYKFMLKWSLIIGGICGLLVPLANGFFDQLWFWNNLSDNMNSVVFIDIFWIFLAVLSFFTLSKIDKLSIVKAKFERISD